MKKLLEFNIAIPFIYALFGIALCAKHAHTESHNPFSDSPFQRSIASPIAPSSLSLQHLPALAGLRPLGIARQIGKYEATFPQQKASDTPVSQPVFAVITPTYYTDSSALADALAQHVIGHIFPHPDNADHLIIGPLAHPAHADLYCKYILAYSHELLSECRAHFMPVSKPIPEMLSYAYFRHPSGAQESEIMAEGETLRRYDLMVVKIAPKGVFLADDRQEIHFVSLSSRSPISGQE